MDGRSSTDRWLWRRISNGATTQIGYRSQRYITVSCRLADDASLLIFQSDRFRCRTAEISTTKFRFFFSKENFTTEKKKTARKTFSDVRDPVASGNRIPTRWTSAVDVAFNELLFFFILIYSQQTASRWMQLTWMRQASKTIPRLFIVSSIDTCNKTTKKQFYFYFIFYFFIIF